jgi:hypothetical protein
VLPQMLPPHGHQTMIMKLHESGGGSTLATGSE